MSSDSSEIQINVKGPSELKLQISIATDKSVLELKQAIADKSDVPADRQRLIYSGRVLKDEDALSVYKIQSSHTIHMVKGAVRNAGSTSGAAPQALPTMQSGQNVHDPLTQLNGHQGYGLMAGLNPFADMGLNPNDPNMMQGMMNNPQFLQQMSSVMSNPQVLDQLIASNPQLQAMGPQVREVFQSERFRQMMSNPDTLRMMLQMSSMMNGGAGAGAGAGAFPAPGLPSTAQNANPNTPGAGASAALGVAPGAGLGLGGGFPMFNPFMLPPSAGAAGAGAGAGGANPMAEMMNNPALMADLMSAFGGGGAGGAGAFGGGAGAFGGAGGAFGGGAAAAPADTRSPEERFQVQLQQLQDMGFTNASQNVRALLATAGNVHAAIEYILGGGGM